MAMKTGNDEAGVSQLSGRINGLQLDSRLEDSDWEYLYVLLTISNHGAPSAVKSWKVSFCLPTGRKHTVADEEFSRQPVGLDGAGGNLVLKQICDTFGRKVYRLAAATLSKRRAGWTIGCDRVLLVRFPN